VPKPPKKRNGKKVAIVGAGPSGLSAAYYLNRAGFSVSVYEGDRKPGGYLRYGIPDFKLDKSFINRRIALMEAEGVKIITNARIGSGRFGFGTAGDNAQLIRAKELESSFDLVLLTIGAREARDMKIPGRELSGIVQALDYLSLQNRAYASERPGVESVSAYGKRVLVIGGGDTGSDCVGTANRQGAMQLTQIEVLPKPPEHRSAEEPWPLWPKVLKTSSSHLEGGERLWSVNSKAFKGKDGRVEAVEACKIEWTVKDGRPVMSEVPGSEFEIAADLVLLAMGFTHVVQDGAVADFGLETDERGNIRTRGSFHTSNPKVWAAGDSRRGASLVVHAIADGRAAAEAIIRSL
jgi:glutamate synthase (NADPH/NADH) small chain